MARMFTGAGSIYADPAFQMGMALGNAYGNLWAHNAKGRQTEKAQNLYDEMFGTGANNEIAEIAAMGGNNAAAADPAEARRQRLTNEVMGATPQQIAAGIMGNIPGTGNAAAGQNATDNALNYIQSQNQLRALSNAGQNQNPIYSADEFAQRARAAGLNQEVIDEFMPDAQKEAARRARETLLPGIAENLYGYTDANGAYVPPTASDYSQAIMDIARLREYDPETAKTLMGGVVSPADIYNNQQQERERILGDESYRRRLQMQDAVKAQAEEREANRQIEMLMRYGGLNREQAERQVMIGRYVMGNGGKTAGTSSATKSPFESAEYKTAAETVKALEEKYSDGMGEVAKMTPNDQRRYEQAQNIMNAAWNSYFDTPQQQQPLNTNDYNAVGNYVRSIAEQARQMGISADEVAAALREEMPNNPYLNDHLINYGLVKG